MTLENSKKKIVPPYLGTFVGAFVAAMLIAYAAQMADMPWSSAATAAHNWFEQLWLTQVAQRGELRAYVYLFAMSHYPQFWLGGGLLTAIFVAQKPHALYKFKIQALDAPRPTATKLLKLVGLIAFNQLCIGTPSALLFYHLYQWRGCFDHFPTLMQLVPQFFAIVFIEEVMFFYSHWLFHQPLFYKRFHKIHHTWKAPLAWSCIYAHPLEHIVSNTLPVFFGPLVVGFHPLFCIIWLFIATQQTMISHSGIHFPFFPSPVEHDYHHEAFNENFGVLGFFDWLHNTNKKFTATRAHKAKMFFNFTPMHQKNSKQN